MIFAEIDPSTAPKGTLMVLQCLFWAGGFALMCVAIVKVIRGKPAAPPNEQLEKDHQRLRHEFDKGSEQNLTDHNALHARIGGAERGLESKLMTRLGEIEKTDKSSRSAMHTELTDLGKQVAALEKETSIQTRNLERMDDKLDQLVARER